MKHKKCFRRISNKCEWSFWKEGRTESLTFLNVKNILHWVFLFGRSGEPHACWNGKASFLYTTFFWNLAPTMFYEDFWLGMYSFFGIEIDQQKCERKEKTD